MTPNYVSTYIGAAGTYGECHALWSERYNRGGVMPIVTYHHPHDSTADSMMDWVNFPGFYSIPVYLAANGYMVMIGDFADTSLARPRAAWGNAVNHNAIADAKALGVTLGGSSTKKIAVVGCSMGACASFSYAARFPTLVACAVGIIPALDLNRFKTPGVNGPFGAQAPFTTVDAAFGGNYTDTTYGSNHNPKFQAGQGKFNSMPTQIWVDDNDTYASYALVNEFVAAVLAANPSAPTQFRRIPRIGAGGSPNSGAGWGHLDPAVLHTPRHAVLQFIQTYLT